MIIWEEKYSTGNAILDKQHQFLFGFVNDMEEAIGNGRGVSYLMKYFYVLEEYAEAHFGIEEECMHKLKCPFAKRNQDAHQKFREYLVQCKEKSKKIGYTEELVVEVHCMLESWLKGHIIEVDTHLKDCI